MIHQAAIMHIATKTIYTLPRPNRHCDIIHMIYEKHGFDSIGSQFEQGFICIGEFYGRELPAFVRRVPAMRIARECGQILPGKGLGRDLFSEDIW